MPFFNAKTLFFKKLKSFFLILISVPRSLFSEILDTSTMGQRQNKTALLAQSPGQSLIIVQLGFQSYKNS